MSVTYISTGCKDFLIVHRATPLGFDSSTEPARDRWVLRTICDFIIRHSDSPPVFSQETRVSFRGDLYRPSAQASLD